jgi:hypothetical protein
MIYLTAGIADSYQEPDIGCESAITKVYCTEALKSCVDQCLAIIAMGKYSFDETIKAYLNDFNYLNNVLSTNDVLKIYVATNGVLLAGTEVLYRLRII